ncbi:type IV pilus assembly protein PilV [Inhella inkyongensis]|uniref:Type IV pilus assembly protein PilV n=1 Tax=Inhella inkyongensis TaxID=392593 RepID=A0A840S465_9BURK|nr:pilus assembly protein PilV [Inhella inkyongensis]MBB5203309.1 type IV pilus assembly protein PilV [Inhella inkyongensis]
MNKHKTQGVAILEALVAILIFSIGILGLIGLQAAMTQAQTTGKIRSDAVNLAEDLFALIQTDHQSNLTQYQTANCATYSRCADWLAKVSRLLPGAGTPAIARNATSGLVTVTLNWAEPNGQAHQYVASMTWNP